MRRTILHVDMNNYFASIEELYHPELRGKPMIVCGDPSLRHGIVLSKNYEAKAYGIITAETIWQAKRKCSHLTEVVADHSKYQKFTHALRELWGEYTDQVEPFGLDEASLDVTKSIVIRGNGMSIADEIRRKSKERFGLQCSVGISDNKVFAKLASDLRKPDQSTLISPQNYKEVVWPLPADSMVGIGRSTRHTLYQYDILTIGDIANSERALLHSILGKPGDALWINANGLDRTPVAYSDDPGIIKSIGNGTTIARDLLDDDDVKLTLYVLAESVSARLRKHKLKCRTVQIGVTDNTFASFVRQGKLPRPTQLTDVIVALAMNLFRANYRWEKPVRKLEVRGADLVSSQQVSFLPEEQEEERGLRLECAKDEIRRRFGHFALLRGIMLDNPLSRLNPQEDNLVMFPIARSS